MSLRIRPLWRYLIGLAFLVWLFGNIPAWLFMGTYMDAGKQQPYALWWTIGILLGPAAAFFATVAILVLRAFAAWVFDADAKRVERESRAVRIDRMERELGIGPYRKESL